ncbi:uncharacterized protein BP5553_00136 [Venustampulla echinocandica]|uniref:Cytochrome P450 n=1 Tax=Venustampulla echinocandica TaxID=2656787 RepID=A0A370TXA7_9HELO|nr:uncharacterized protein BP5553_00136 [Venustampulla echinocandica]RDL40157.1 hypothetical protein BP5553_00136 [Venustampulla echinocandica]
MGSGFHKGKFYSDLLLKGTLVCISSNKEHAMRRKAFPQAFTQKNLLEWESMIKRAVTVSIEKMREAGAEGKEVDILAGFTSMASGIIGEFCFGESFKSGEEEIHQIGENPNHDAVIKGIQSELLIPGGETLRNVPSYLQVLPLPILRLVLSSWSALKTPGKQQALKRDNLIQSTKHKTLLTKALAENEESLGLSDEVIVREAKAFIIAGTDTTAVTATYLVWAVLNHPEVKAKLQREVDSLPLDFSVAEVQSLPYLQLVITEMLRMYGSASGSLPRATPAGGKQIGEWFVPEGTEVSTQAYTLHHNPDIFEDPYLFRPERWEKRTPQMKEAYMPFAIGARGCIGQNLAQIELALSITAFLRKCPNARVASSMTDFDMEIEDNFVMSPKGHKCMVIL